MTGHDFRGRLRGGELLLGTMLTLPSGAVAEILSAIGFDWIFVDAEHGPLETAEVMQVLEAAGARTACLVRVPALDEVAVKKVLDLGAAGIIVPQVNSPEQAADAVRYARYPPAGTRGVGVARAQGYGFAFDEYLATANDEIAVIVQAEHAAAVEQIDRIVAVPGVDAVLLGPYDLSASLGRPGKIDDPVVVEAIERVTAACLRAGVAIGYFGMTAEAVAPYVARGHRLVVAGVDTVLLGSAGRALHAALRALPVSD